MEKEKGSDPFNEPIIVGKTRILRPKETKLLWSGIPKNQYQIIFNALLCSGMRYSEFLMFQDNPKWFSESEQKIFLPKNAVRKKKIVRKQRWINLSPFGAMVVSSFLNGRAKAPDRRTWYDNLIRWGEHAGMDVSGFSVKMTRKTVESWLLAFYPDNIIQVLLSQGHTADTAINHYLSLGFTKQDKEDMSMFIEGWI